jgi:tRNA threonylcarbamoyladenosine biosynthesis protein TsaB
LRILAIETSGAEGGVAALDDQELLLELPLNPAQRGAQSLAPALASLLQQVGWQPRDVQLVGVTVGPGSFTSLRVGVTTAKTLAYAVSAEILGLGTLEVIAAQADLQAGGLVAAAIDAQRGDVYAALYRRGTAGDQELMQGPAIVAAPDWLAGATRQRLVTGPALDKLAIRLPPEQNIAPQDVWRPTAHTLGRLAAAKYAAGERNDVWSLVPLYLRKSAAEERAELLTGSEGVAPKSELRQDKAD